MKPLTLEKIVSGLDGQIITSNRNNHISKIAAKFGNVVPQCVLLVQNNIQDEGLFVSKLEAKKVREIIAVHPSLKLIEMCTKSGIGIIEVKSFREALCNSAKLQRMQYDIPFVQIIGSSGKTTTKEMIASILTERIPFVKTSKNYNFPTEIAKKILSINQQHGAVILEVGMITPNMMKQSSSMIKPDIAVVTSIHRAHLMRFGTIENIISAKAQMLRYLSKSGTLIINGEEENCEKFLQKYHGKNVLTFGFSKKCDIWASNIIFNDGKTSFQAISRYFSVNCSLNTFGKYNVLNALAAILVGIKLGMNIGNIVNGLSKFTPVKNRLEILKGINDTIIVNDNFNANPDSTKLLLESIPSFAKDRPIILVMGDMENPSDGIEKYARKVHFWIGQEASKIPFQHMMAIGKWAKDYINGALINGVDINKLHYFRDLDKPRLVLPKLITPNSVVVFKASPYVKVRSLIPAILKN